MLRSALTANSVLPQLDAKPLSRAHERALNTGNRAHMPRISELLASISRLDLVLPEFQREYVWNREQAKQLVISLVKEYPVGGLLIWKTNDPPELKNIDRLPERLGTVDVLLDGQQRLTTLYMLITGEIPGVLYDRRHPDRSP
jgi:hypothetical protein